MWHKIVNRQFTPKEFGKYVVGLKFTTWRPDFIVLHNTGAPLLSQWHSTSAHQRMLNLEHYYRDTQGWSAGPHLFISDTEINVFTPLTVPGIHTPSWNHISWGIEMAGNFDIEPFDNRVKMNTVSAIATLSIAIGLDSSSLHFHREDPRTTHRHCPGRNVSKNDMIGAVHKEILSHNQGEHLQDRMI